MIKKKKSLGFIILALMLVITATGLTIWQYGIFSRQTCVFPAGFQIGSVPVEGLSPEEAVKRLQLLYQAPVTLEVDQASMQISTEQAGVSYDWEAVFGAAVRACEEDSSIHAFWEFLWQNSKNDFDPIPLSIKVDQVVLSEYIRDEILPRYQLMTGEPYPISGTTQFANGTAGISLDEVELARKITSAFHDLPLRSVKIESAVLSAPMPSLEQIEYLLRENIRTFEFNGIVEIYLQDLSSDEEIQFATLAGEPIQSGIAFTAASTMKIPIMVSTMWRENLPLNEMVSGWLNYMIILSENDPADRLMERIDPISGPLRVTADMQVLDLENTFISGYFYLGAPLLSINSTPANSRADINTNPDLYNQTTTADIGHLLAGIYDCAENGQGLLVEKSEGRITAEKCQIMIDILSRNQIGALIEAGLPEGMQIAHKHGWSEEEDGLLHTVSDVAIVYGPEKDFVLTIFVYSPGQLLFEEANYLVSRLAQTAFNGLNPNHQLQWLFER